MAEEVNDTGTRLALVVVAVLLTTWALFFIFIFVLVIFLLGFGSLVQAGSFRVAFFEVG